MCLQLWRVAALFRQTIQSNVWPFFSRLISVWCSLVSRTHRDRFNSGVFRCARHGVGTGVIRKLRLISYTEDIYVTVHNRRLEHYSDDDPQQIIGGPAPVRLDIVLSPCLMFVLVKDYFQPTRATPRRRLEWWLKSIFTFGALAVVHTRSIIGSFRGNIAVNTTTNGPGQPGV